MVNGRPICLIPMGSGSCGVRFSGGYNTILVQATDATGDMGRTSIRVRTTRHSD